MSRADKLKGEGVREKEKHDTEVKQLVQTLKVAAGSSDMDDHTSQLRDAGIGELFSTSAGLKKGWVMWGCVEEMRGIEGKGLECDNLKNGVVMS